MPMIIEDGTLPENANSYVSLEQADAYLVPRGLWPATEVKEEPQEPENPEIDKPDEIDVLLAGQSAFLKNAENATDLQPELPDTSKPDDNPDIAKKETALMRAFDYLDTLKWKGNRVDWQRQTAWPRVYVPIPGSSPERPQYIPEDVVPDAVKKAQMELAALIYNGVDMFKPLERGGQYQQQSHSYSKGVDVLSKSERESVAYASNAPKDAWLPSVYPLLRDFLDEVPGETSGFTVHDILRG